MPFSSCLLLECDYEISVPTISCLRSVVMRLSVFNENVHLKQLFRPISNLIKCRLEWMNYAVKYTEQFNGGGNKEGMIRLVRVFLTVQFRDKADYCLPMV